MRLTLLTFSLLAFVLPAQAGAFDSVDDRETRLNQQLQGNNSYHAHLARELASIASIEKGQHDIGVARKFMDMAEQHAARAGGAK
ncbi:MAG: hypothetical protein R8L58_08425 [Mariprofundaceae bacterium]